MITASILEKVLNRPQAVQDAMRLVTEYYVNSADDDSSTIIYHIDHNAFLQAAVLIVHHRRPKMRWYITNQDVGDRFNAFAALGEPEKAERFGIGKHPESAIALLAALLRNIGHD